MDFDKTEKDNSSVQVAVRIRPLIDNEVSKGSVNILEVFPALQQIRIKNTDKAFTFNYVADMNTTQDTFYNSGIKHMISNLFKGYNMTILAYGQTGSGKTHSMGTTYNGEGEMGVIPRVVNDIFNYVNDNFAYDFTITVSFMELYQEILYDLLSKKSRDQSVIEIREDLKGIILPGLTEEPVTSATRTLECLLRGSQGRATSSTNMNAQSSRSHAIFTINIFMQRKDNSNMNKTAKFHLVDLAGSERSKKTGATGVTFKEGVNINKGLLALGNVISALGDEKQNGFIGYRDSHLTRLLKDSLGGNSITLMIACVSPADYNLDESLSTLRYADRARKIKNKPIVNEDPKTAEINRLNKLITQLRLELLGQGGPIICQAELDLLRNENSSMRNKIRELTFQLSTTLNENMGLIERVMIIQTGSEAMSKKLLELKDSYNITLSNLNLSIEQNNTEAIKDHLNKLTTMQDIFSDLDCDRKKTEDEVRRHERSTSNSMLTHSDLAMETELNEKQETRTLQQMNMYAQLQEVTKSLAMKEDLAQQILSQNYGVVDYNAMKENEGKIKSLEEEKDKLVQQLKNTQTQGVSGKLAEQRRKQVKELEKQIEDLKKKIKEQAQLIRLKENDELRIRKLNNEIQQMKITKVNLIKSMKQESEKFRSWKLLREKELLKLKDQERKRQNQIVKMETLHSRQQNVLKRKVEEVAAVNKRLKDVLALRKNVHDQKNAGKVERLGPWIQQELDIFVSTVDAEATIALLLEDRETLAQQLQQLKENNEFADMKPIEDEIELRTSQIAELNQKIIDSDQENKAKTRWENVQTMAEAKFCLKTVFDYTAEIRKKEATNEIKLNELQQAQLDASKKFGDLNKEINYLKFENQHELFNTKREYEEKIAILLRQLRGVPLEGEGDLQARFAIQQQIIDEREKELEELKQKQLENEQKLHDENEQLKKTIEEIKGALQQSVNSEFTICTPVTKKVKVEVNEQTPEMQTPLRTILTHEESFEAEDNVNMDPDWRNTPLAKRLQKMKRNEAGGGDERLTVKRSSDGSCACKGNCSRRSCGCKKLGKQCGSQCKCQQDLCANRDTEKENQSVDDEQSSTINDETFTFKKPRSLDDETLQNVSTRRKIRKPSKGRFKILD